jgi:hypothetical protein
MKLALEHSEIDQAEFDKLVEYSKKARRWMNDRKSELRALIFFCSIFLFKFQVYIIKLVITNN